MGGWCRTVVVEFPVTVGEDQLARASDDSCPLAVGIIGGNTAENIQSAAIVMIGSDKGKHS
jgi:hypothetical protein